MCTTVIIIIIIITYLLEFSCHSVAVVLTPVQTEQIRINIYLVIMFIDSKLVDTRWQWSFNMLHMHGLWRLII